MKRIVTLGMVLVIMIVSLVGCFVDLDGHEGGERHERHEGYERH